MRKTPPYSVDYFCQVVHKARRGQDLQATTHTSRNSVTEVVFPSSAVNVQNDEADREIFASYGFIDEVEEESIQGMEVLLISSLVGGSSPMYLFIYSLHYYCAIH